MRSKSVARANKQGNKNSKVQNLGVELSVIIPTYNLSTDLKRCIASLYKQKLSGIEIIIVDDCSTDDTRDIIASCAGEHKEIVPIYQERNAGPAAARNAGLDIATGKYIHFCDGDDTVPDGAYREMLDIAYKNDADIVTGNYSRRYPNEKNAVRQFSNYHAPTGFERCFESGNTTLWNKIYKRSFINKHQFRFAADMRLYEDFLFFNQLLLKKPVVAYTDISVYVYTEPQQQEDFLSKTNKIRYANADCARCFAKAWKILLSEKVSSHKEFWRNAYITNLNWIYHCSWQLIQDVDERNESYLIIKDLLMWVQKNVEWLDWTKDDRGNEFRAIFYTDYPSFAAMDYETYLMTAAQELCPPSRGVICRSRKDLLGLHSSDNCDYDVLLQGAVEKEISAIYEVFTKDFANKRQWVNNYWTTVDSMVNDYWRQICDPAIKERLYEKIRTCIADMRRDSPICRFNKPDDIWRFCAIFGVDYVMLQTFSLSQYLFACSVKAKVVTNNVESIRIETNPEVFINQCRSGNMGMKTILRASKAWLSFKLKRVKIMRRR